MHEIIRLGYWNEKLELKLYYGHCICGTYHENMKLSVMWHSFVNSLLRQYLLKRSKMVVKAEQSEHIYLPVDLI